MGLNPRAATAAGAAADHWKSDHIIFGSFSIYFYLIQFEQINDCIVISVQCFFISRFTMLWTLLKQDNQSLFF